MPQISIILSSYNHADYIGTSIKSILSQTYSNFQLIIIDDCSTDSSWEIINSIHDDRIQAVRREKNLGGGIVAQVLTNYDCAEYIAIAHCDDVWKPDKLEKQLAYLETHSEVAACFTQAELIDEQDEPLPPYTHFFDKAFNRDNRSRFAWLREFYDNGGGLCHPSLLIRKSAYTEYGLANRGLSSIPDFCQWIRLCARAEIYVYPEKLTQFRVRAHGLNTSGDRPEVHYRNTTEFYFVLQEFLRVKDPLDFIKVFPETEKYLINGEMVVPFAFAQMLLLEEDKPFYILFALQLIYDLMKDNVLSNKVELLYGFTARDFAQEKLKWDVFSQIPESRFMNSRLYVDFGDGFDDANSITISKVYCNSDNQFEAAFSLQELRNKKMPKRFRFDPDDSFFREFSDMTFKQNGVSLAAKPIGAVRKDSMDHFYTLDCQYLLDCELSSGDLYITGKTKTISLWDVDLHFNSLALEHEKQMQKKAELEAQYEVLQHEHAELQHEHTELQHEHTELQKDYSALQDSRENLQQSHDALAQQFNSLTREHNQLTQYLKTNKMKAIIKLLLNRNII